MKAFKKIALIGFGEVGQTLGADLITSGAEVSAFDILLEFADSAPFRALDNVPVRAASSIADAVKSADLVISAVTVAAELDVARATAEAIPKGAFYLDLNSVSPGTKLTASELIGRARARFVEAAVMTPIAIKRIASPMLLGGPHAAAFLEFAQPLGFNGEVFSSAIGQASAAKMCRSVIVKGMEALISESMLAARNYGVEAAVLNSLSDLLPNPDWEKTARYLISRALEHGKRRAEEMREAAKTVDEAGVTPLMSEAAAKRQDWSAEHKGALVESGDLAALLDALRKGFDMTRRGAAA